ncbi:hypothetical protein EYB26_009472 [Talaromyces marneffei]|uniref:uncharacterized protein n=1 Tax=Talaromyces marneffei TaxID=37727 RepID=UPI0012A7AAB5|nr:uncharacterized protein EYB26_009472 [Talaromyces marneffei]QGA21761.1 hypothetical protein EYB26_009472 [Talaromyces marneffei]
MPKRSSAVVDATASQPQAKRAKKETTTTEDAPQPVETPSKKRGRPRKESLAAGDVPLPSAKRRGRPAKDSSVLPKESASCDSGQKRPTSQDKGCSRRLNRKERFPKRQVISSKEDNNNIIIT